MKRTDISELFPDATSEQIDMIMNINGADINAAKKDVSALQAQLEEANNKLKSPSEELIAAQKQAKTLQGEIDKMKAAESIRLMREKVANENGVPSSLLTGATEEDCSTQAQAILAFAKKNGGYPTVRDAGETTIEPTQTTRDQFADWFNKLK